MAEWHHQLNEHEFEQAPGFVDGPGSLAWRILSINFYQLRQHIEKQRHYFADKGLSGQSYDFSNSHVWM